jgi:hypothetical protein
MRHGGVLPLHVVVAVELTGVILLLKRTFAKQREIMRSCFVYFVFGSVVLLGYQDIGESAS